MFGTKKILWFTILVLFFSAIIFSGELILSGFAKENEEDFLDRSIYDKRKIDYIRIAKNVIKEKKSQEDERKRRLQIMKKIQKLKQTSKDTLNDINTKPKKVLSPLIYYNYIPETFVGNILEKKKNVTGVLSGDRFRDLIKTITLEFHAKRVDVRGKMKNKTIKLFAPQSMEEDELLAILVHELAHYIDLYFLERIDGADISNEFYDISWYSTIVLKAGLKGQDFVSGYAMTNKYEDLAETLTYYVFHNDDFVAKMKDSDVLKKKYRFISNAVFGDNSFISTDFSEKNKIKNYYRDITKIHFSKKNFLQYVKNTIY